MRNFFFVLLLAMFCSLIGCVQPSAPAQDDGGGAPETSLGGDRTDVLIYEGSGTWKAEIRSLKEILYQHGATYGSVTESEMNAMSLDDFSKFRAVLFVGGNSLTVKSALTPDTRARMREAVRERGLNYLGFCAGAWLAVETGVGVVDGGPLSQSFMGREGLEFSLDTAAFPDGSTRRLLWYGGPITPEEPQSVVAKYSDGTAAISQVRSGKGWVVISGFHPAATKGILRSLNLGEPQAIAPELAWQLLEAVIKDKHLATFVQ